MEEKQQVVKVTVTSGTVKLQSIKISSSTEILTKGEGKTIYVTYNPNNVTDKTLYWSSSNEKVATVSEGYVKSRRRRNCNINSKIKKMGIKQQVAKW